MSLQNIKAHLEASDHNWTIGEIEDGLTITNSDGIPAHLVLTENQMIIETILFKESEIKDVAQFDDLMMQAQKGLPLTSVGKSEIGGTKYYVAFGALSSSSILDNVELELVMLFQNVTEILHSSSDFLREAK